MVKLKLDIVDIRNTKSVGNVYINMLLFLKNNWTSQEEIKGVFPIFKCQKYCNKPEINEKIGDVEIDILIKFYN
jgi:hypothetical protein